MPNIESKLLSLRLEILDLVSSFGDEFVKKDNFEPGKSLIPVSGKVLDPRDFVSLVDSVLDGWFTGGRFTTQFEKALSKFIGMRRGLFVNSGSSANLVALSSLTSSKLGDKRLVPGDEVISVAMGFPTTVNPIIQNRLKPVLVDVESNTLEVDIQKLREAITKRTRAIMLAHTLGNPFNVDEVLAICKEFDLWLIEDNCDALGSIYKGKMTGSFGDVSTVSFYPAHHITTGEGGMVFTKSPLIEKQAESFRDWGRDCYCETGCDNTCKKRFDWELGKLPKGYDHKYIYSHIGYNLKATDMQAALGISQFSKIDEFVARRIENFNYLKDQLKELEGITLAEATEGSIPAWFGFPITLNDNHPANREELLRFLESRRIGTRLMFAGNIVKQPAYLDVNIKVVGGLKNTDTLMNRAFWLGVYPGLTFEMLDYVADSIKEFFRKY